MFFSRVDEWSSIIFFIEKKHFLMTNSNLNEIEQLHRLTDRTEQVLKTAVNSNFDRNDQLNVLLDRSDLLLNKNQTFGVGMFDYRKEIERNQTLNRLKWIGIGSLLFLVFVLIVVLNIFLRHSNRFIDQS